MKLHILLSLFIALSIEAKAPVFSHSYEYNDLSPRTKFSDWVPYRLNKWNPRFLEDYYQLYGLKLYYGENKLRKNIYFLKTGLRSRFRHPKHALCAVKSERGYHKYRLLLTMHLNMQIMRSYLRIGSLYDKRHLYFHNLDFAHELKKSFQTAISFYKQARPYWKEAQKHALAANQIRIDLDIGTVESERYDIATGKLNYDYIINTHIAKAEKKLDSVREYIIKYPEADKPVLEHADSNY
ncbi:MAG: hypothetical protein AAF518_16445 [Spirochaetota bacterium]